MPAFQKSSWLHRINKVLSNWVKELAATCSLSGSYFWFARVAGPGVTHGSLYLFSCARSCDPSLSEGDDPLSTWQARFLRSFSRIWLLLIPTKRENSRQFDFLLWSTVCIACDCLATSLIPALLRKVSWDAACCRGQRTGLIYWMLLQFFFISNFFFFWMQLVLFSSLCAECRKPLWIVEFLFYSV